MEILSNVSITFVPIFDQTFLFRRKNRIPPIKNFVFEINVEIITYQFIFFDNGLYFSPDLQIYERHENIRFYQRVP